MENMLVPLQTVVRTLECVNPSLACLGPRASGGPCHILILSPGPLVNHISLTKVLLNTITPTMTLHTPSAAVTVTVTAGTALSDVSSQG